MRTTLSKSLILSAIILGIFSNQYFVGKNGFTSQSSTVKRLPAVTNTFSGLYYAKLANSHIAQHNAGLAMTAATVAEKFNETNSFDYEYNLFQAYVNLHQVTLALKHGPQCLMLAQKENLSHDVTNSIKWWCQDFQTRLISYYSFAPMPKIYSPTELQTAIDSKLTADERKNVVNPLASTPEMEAWSRRITLGATNDMDKAKLLFEELIHRLDSNTMQTMTAKEAFANFDHTDASLHCQEYAFLYTSLARAVGLKVFVTTVAETCYGERTAHACAALFLNGRQVLVDPSYFWFGVTHKKYRVLDDLQTTALYLSRFVDIQDAMAACKLAPDLLQAQGQLFCAFVGEDRWDEAKALLPVINQLDFDEGGNAYFEGRIAIHEKRYTDAAKLFEKSVKDNPTNGASFINLGSTLIQLGRFDEAQAAFRKSLNCALFGDAIESVHQQLAWLDNHKKLE